MGTQRRQWEVGEQWIGRGRDLTMLCVEVAFVAGNAGLTAGTWREGARVCPTGRRGSRWRTQPRVFASGVPNPLGGAAQPRRRTSRRVVKSLAAPSKIESDISERTAQEALQKRIAESKYRVNSLAARILIRAAEAQCARAEEELIQGYPETVDGTEGAESFVQRLAGIRGDLEKSGKDLELIARDHEAVVDPAAELIRIHELAKTIEEIENKYRPVPEVEGLDAGGERTEHVERLPPVEEIRQRISRVGQGLGQGLEKSVGAFVRSDGSIDFSSIRSAAQITLGKGAETWARLNGLTPEGASLRQALEESPVMWNLRTEIESLEKQLSDASRGREQRLRKEDQLGKLIKAREIREMDDNVNTVRRMLAVRVLELELERIYLYLRNESETTQDFFEERLLILEFGQLDERLAVLKVFLDAARVLLIEDDELGELAGDVAFLKSRVGLENDFYTTTWDWPKVKRSVSDGAGKIKEGAEFFWRGIRLLSGDVAYAFRLIRKAAVGFTLSPREVRTLRRTGRDIITFIPFTIILILPLSPIGHVLVFSFIQRFFPDFFPTTFSERRQTLMKRYEQMRIQLDEDTVVQATAATGPPAPAHESGGDSNRTLDDIHLAE